MNDKKYIALLDILGFKELIEKNSHKDVVSLFDNFRIYVQMALAKQKSTVDKLGRPVYDVSKSKINSIIISDSLIFWTNGEELEDFFELVDCLHRFLQFCHNKAKIFVRGGITYGDFSYNNSGTIIGNHGNILMHPIIVGKALVDAHLIEKNLQIAGCVIDENALTNAKESNEAKFISLWNVCELEKVVVKYDIPFKSGKQKTWSINWVNNFSEINRDFEKDFSTRKKSITSSEVKEKIKNTEDYYNFIRKI